MPDEPVSLLELIKEQVDRLDQRIDDLAALLGKQHEAQQTIRDLFNLQSKWLNQLDDYWEGERKRAELTTLVAGYMYAALEAIRDSGQISDNVRARVLGSLAYARPIIAEIMSLPKDKPADEQAPGKPE